MVVLAVLGKVAEGAYRVQARIMQTGYPLVSEGPESARLFANPTRERPPTCTDADGDRVSLCTRRQRPPGEWHLATEITGLVKSA